MANTLATPTWVLREVAYEFTNSLKFLFNVDRTYDDQYMQAGAKVGNTVKARRPQRFQVTDGQALQLQDLLDETVDITLTNQKNVAFGYSSAQATTELDAIRDRYVKRGAEVLANACDALAFEDVYKSVYHAVGSPGTVPSTNLTYLQGGDKITDMAGRTEGRKAVLDTRQMSTLVNANLTLFNPSAAISEEYRTGMFGRNALGFSEWYIDQARPTFTTGAVTVASTPLVAGANQTGTSLLTDGWGSGGLAGNKGDVFTLAGVFSVNPDTYISTGRLQQFALTADISDTTGDATLSITPSIITSGALQTVSASPANNAVITYWDMSAGGTYAEKASPVGMLFLPEAFAFVMADLKRPNGGANAEMYRSRKYNIAMRFVEQYQIGNDQNPSRLDVLIGAAAIEPRFACRVQS